MVHRIDWMVKVTLLLIAGFLGIIAVRPLVEPETKALAQAARFDHVTIVSPVFLYKGEQGLLVLDKRSANVWFIPRRNEVFATPIFLTKLPFEKLDQAPQ